MTILPFCMIQSTTFYLTIPNIWNEKVKKSEKCFKKLPPIAQQRPENTMRVSVSRCKTIIRNYTKVK